MTAGSQDTIELLMPSQLRFLNVVDSVVQSFAAEFDLQPDDVNAISTAAIEAASNAMEHANKFDDDKFVRMRIRARGTIVELEIEDQGTGFDHRPYERELGPEDLLKLRGRGIFIMRSFMDEVFFKKLPEGGTRVVLRKIGKQKSNESDQENAARGN